MYSAKTALSFPENGYPDKQSVLEAVNKKGLSNNFTVKIKEGKFTTLHLACSKAGAYWDKCNISEEKRKKGSNSSLTGCPFLLRFSFKKKSNIYLSFSTRGDNKNCHDHPVIPENLVSSHQGRISLLTTDDTAIAKTMLETHTKSRDVQKATSDKRTEIVNLRISDIDNLKYSGIRGASESAHGTTELIRTMKAKGFSVLYEFKERNSLKHIFFTNDIMIKIALSFLDVFIMNATCKTNCTKMPLVCVEGVSNLNGERLKIFHVEFAMIIGTKHGVFDKNLELFKSLSSQKYSQSKEQLENDTEYSIKVKKWAGYLASQLRHLDCLTTQRVQGGHNFEGDYQDLKFNEATITDARSYHEPRLHGLISHVSRIGLITIRPELLEEVVSGELCDRRCEGDQQMQNTVTMVDELVEDAASEVKAFGRPSHGKQKTALSKDFVLLDKEMPVFVTNKNVHEFSLLAQINQAAILLTFNPKSDGRCGFRVCAHLKEGGENQLPLVKKKMLATLAIHRKLYEHNVGLDVAKVTKVIAFGSEINPVLGESISSFPFSVWFSAPDCAQIIAGTYNEPILVYSDDLSVFLVILLPLLIGSLSNERHCQWSCTMDMGTTGKQSKPTLVYIGSGLG
ncbi:hypothetical protein PHYBLDRAFT_183959 [Phycomyces blakesleeanus NRRL 1555(-)]|uniref:Uncharacterized protein n=1 Tax=Phycomyces blakesleeanus (strain ATCC 8743b / DSM 1359 / FGSC 10004 / NBRC 33097 / NRRL 1555) TaxID=763407 RepID=A0A162TCF1_PHYB8|nr:hypothetical protein PHYBLDRAFT_183959 [Phycomyces blakesleeanus NRRL 1555(-)]OAD66013.1 hypothetical protein PHYBLDRAFT_183959 [Phycomyces blakesleeanus NRRL 1555(-)]|eukprot:XP_018284053.1 hypothetical protein PHYBLDRAFT_183959 [Phycomyces blakesleeanus NRRL 1555(-)]